MKITYIAHSGFFVDFNGLYMLFDYYYGDIPDIPRGSRIYVFCSHKHQDHFNPEIFRLLADYDAIFVLAYDIKMNDYNMRKWGIDSNEAEKANILKKVVSIRYDESLELGEGELSVKAYKSTDTGVSYLVEAAIGEEKGLFYHAGDHGWWHWDGMELSVSRNMEVNYKRGIALLVDDLNGQSLDAAFVVLDSRQGEYSHLGMCYFLENVNANAVFPMHCWNDYGIINTFMDKCSLENGKKVAIISKEGQSFEL